MSDTGRNLIVRLCSLLLLVCVVLIATARAETRRGFDLAVQPLGAALSEYSALTGMAVLFDSSLVSGRYSSAVQGVFSDEAALAQLLANTGLKARYSGGAGFTLQRIAAPAGSSPGTSPAGAVDARRYARLVQHTVWQVLCGDPLTQPGGYRAAIQLRLDVDGRVTEARLLASTGDPLRDAAINKLLVSLKVALAPPPSMAQPITLLLTQHDDRDTRACPGAE